MTIENNMPRNARNGSPLLTAQMIEENRPELLRRVAETEDNVEFAYTINADEDELILDCFVAAAGGFFEDSSVDGAELTITVDKGGRSLMWQVPVNDSDEVIQRKYALPEDAANAIRFLLNYMELDMDLPLVPVRLRDRLEIEDGHLSLNGRPMRLVYPENSGVVSVDPDPARNCMGFLTYYDKDDQVCQAVVDDILLADSAGQ